MDALPFLLEKNGSLVKRGKKAPGVEWFSFLGHGRAWWWRLFPWFSTAEQEDVTPGDPCRKNENHEC